MAASAYILMNAEPSQTRAVLDQLEALPGTVVREVLGPYDIIVELEADTPEDITATMRNRIRPISGVTNTVTCLWFSQKI